jgi:glycosyltransferase involved in cell wall biosynthesis
MVMGAVSIIIPTYNRSKLLRRSITSALVATEPADEIIVVDDGSTDDTAEVVSKAGEGVRFMQTKHLGAGAARNAGIAQAKHDLIAFMDSDDEWLPTRLLLQRPLMAADQRLAFSFSDFGQLYPDGRREAHFLANWHKDTRSWSEILGPGKQFSEILPLPSGHPDASVHFGKLYHRELGANYVNVNTLMVRQSLVGPALKFAEDLPTCEDWECFARISKVGTCAFINCDTALQRSHEGPRLTNTSWIQQIEARLTLIERNWAADAEFMATHRDEVRKLIASLQRARVRQLIYAGRVGEATALLPCLENALIERLALCVPPSLLRVCSSLASILPR